MTRTLPADPSDSERGVILHGGKLYRYAGCRVDLRNGVLYASYGPHENYYERSLGELAEAGFLSEVSQT